MILTDNYVRITSKDEVMSKKYYKESEKNNMKCIYHKSNEAVTNCSICHAPLCNACASHFSKIICLSCANEKRTEMMGENKKMLKYLLWSVPIAMILGFTFFRMVNGCNHSIAYGIVGAFWFAGIPAAIRRGHLVYETVNDVLEYEIFISQIIGAIIFVLTGIVCIYISWLALIIEIILYFYRRYQIQYFSERL